MSLAVLPPEIQYRILQFLPPSALIRLRRVNRTLSTIATSFLSFAVTFLYEDYHHAIHNHDFAPYPLIATVICRSRTSRDEGVELDYSSEDHMVPYLNSCFTGSEELVPLQGRMLKPRHFQHIQYLRLEDMKSSCFQQIVGQCHGSPLEGLRFLSLVLEADVAPQLSVHQFIRSLSRLEQLFYQLEEFTDPINLPDVTSASQTSLREISINSSDTTNVKGLIDQHEGRLRTLTVNEWKLCFESYTWSEYFLESEIDELRGCLMNKKPISCIAYAADALDFHIEMTEPRYFSTPGVFFFDGGAFAELFSRLRDAILHHTAPPIAVKLLRIDKKTWREFRASGIGKRSFHLEIFRKVQHLFIRIREDNHKMSDRSFNRIKGRLNKLLRATSRLQTIHLRIKSDRNCSLDEILEGCKWTHLQKGIFMFPFSSYEWIKNGEHRTQSDESEKLN